ncbi:hypothetical protein PBI_MRMAGOO_169 [Mycobacterium phage MrMagoo]|uniref:Uncharacterized protein n=1 Tax=Mycobacterium phage MrMagoo TaxID=1927020 RepID=A0A1L6BYT4_9CAUD|nr:hypothetical protein J4U04_gp111 [Mycobacterium phage MrMagoo]APQ42260.1 hypothetical protein PBI_MRMAGOO_169 [Mycobacterium phage MrMagoo]
MNYQSRNNVRREAEYAGWQFDPNTSNTRRDVYVRNGSQLTTFWQDNGLQASWPLHTAAGPGLMKRVDLRGQHDYRAWFGDPNN